MHTRENSYNIIAAKY